LNNFWTKIPPKQPYCGAAIEHYSGVFVHQQHHRVLLRMKQRRATTALSNKNVKLFKH
jgi:hypothetical protein